jgi:hypothetical protein
MRSGYTPYMLRVIPLSCISVGFLIAETKRVLALAPNLGDIAKNKYKPWDYPYPKIRDPRPFVAQLSNAKQMKPRHTAAVALVLLTLSACSPVEHHTDQQAAMAGINYNPSKCEFAGSIYDCTGEHALPDANAGVTQSGLSSDTRVLRGICQQGFHYETGGCQKD